MPDEDDRPRDGSSAADASWTDVVVPDDPRDLAADVAAYHRELRSRRRRDRFERTLGNHRAFPLLMVGVALAIAGIVAALLTLLTGGGVGRQRPAGALADPSTAAGKVGGLLPSAELIAANQNPAQIAISSRDPQLRPAVIAVIGANCNCANLLAGIDGAASSEDVQYDIVIEARTDSFAPTWAIHQHGATASAFYDQTGRIGTAIGAHGVSVLVVEADGTIYTERTGVNEAYIRDSLNRSVSAISVPVQASG